MRIKNIDNMDSENINLQMAQMSLILVSRALNELLVVNEQKQSAKEGKLMNLSPFSFYRVSLQYIIIMEFTKLLEPDTKDNSKKWETTENKNAASLSKLSRIIYESKMNIFLDHHNENKKTLSEIRNTKFYKDLKYERDKKFSHSDKDYNGKTYGIKTFSEKDINESFNYLEKLKNIYKICSNAYNVPELIYIKDNGTRVFIDYHILYKEFYNNNLKKAISEGYTTNKGK